MKTLFQGFDLKSRGSTVGTEFRGAVATFLTMAYILFANPSILKDAGIPFESAMACTAAASGICCILMGLFGNFPLAMACGMGLNAVVVQIAGVTGSWQTAMGIVVLDGLVILILVLLGLREAVMHAIPRDLRLAIGAGIGLFIAFIGAVSAGLVQDSGMAMPPVTFGRLTNPQTALAIAVMILTGFLLARQVRGAIVIGILSGTVIALIFGVTTFPDKPAMPDFSIAFQADIFAAMNLAFLPLLLSLVLVDFFDTIGTVTAVAEQAGLRDEKGNIPRIRSILLIDSLSASLGGLFGVSSVTSYIESAAGVSEGARTGLHSVFVGAFFLLAIFLAPWAGMVPAAATAPALILVGFFMASQITRIDFNNRDTAIPAFVTMVLLPFTWSISHGIGYGFITYVAIKCLSGRFRDIHPLMAATAAAFAGYFLWGGG